MAVAKRDLHGVILLDKPAGISSNRALQRVKRLLGARKAGHTGSLDPMATGMLPICLGDATRFSQYLLDADKRYTVVARLGARSSTGDAEGEIVERAKVPEMGQAGWQSIADGFVGEIQQVPPMYSALKHEGRRLYDLARQGKTVARKPRTIHIYSLRITAVDNDILKLDVRCSKGTYIRTLVEDLATAAGTLGWTEVLRRTEVVPFPKEMVSLEQLLDDAGAERNLNVHILPVSACVRGMPSITIDESRAHAFCEGQSIDGLPGEGRFCALDPTGRLLGVFETDAAGAILARKVLSSAREQYSEARKP